ncbi:DNA adenine methylase [uncultured Microscilla sp.]|uniref:DNA adenine methylase n=1 Tax=uncultured Microscilla sp. TaxID=432653 RepID=UPI0026080576|nr:DNA adenine methylase [uncultured Microscilla sp.]
MNYIGSKKSLLNFLETSIYQVVKEKHFTFLDLFAGTGAVGQHFKKLGNKVIANDLQYYSYVLNKNYIENHAHLEFKSLCGEIDRLEGSLIEMRAADVCKYLDDIEGTEGFIYNNYCLEGTKDQEHARQYYSDANGKKADAIRQKIEDWKRQGLINDNEYFFLLATLIENLDKVANTASVYGAFLKKLKQSAQKPLQMIPANFVLNNAEHQVFNENIEALIEKVQGDVMYLDPPYNHRQYAPNYHLLETIAKYDNPTIKGKTGLRDYSNQKSNFSIKKQVLNSFENIISKAKVKYIFLSYNNEGLMSVEDVERIMSKRGKYGLFTQEYSRFKADKDTNRDHKASSVMEYLHYVVCD